MNNKALSGKAINNFVWFSQTTHRMPRQNQHTIVMEILNCKNFHDNRKAMQPNRRQPFPSRNGFSIVLSTRNVFDNVRMSVCL